MRPAGRETVAVIDASRSVQDAVATIRSLRRSHPELMILAVTAGNDDDGPLTDADGEPRRGTLASVIASTWLKRACHILVVYEATTFPLRALDPACVLVNDDLTVGTVSFLSDGSGFLALAPAPGSLYDDVDAVTAALRAGPAVPAPVPVPFAAGPAVLVSAYAMSAVGAVSDEAPALVEFSLRARRRGFVDVVDPSTFIGRPNGGTDGPVPAEAVELRNALAGPASPLAILRTAARATVAGLSVLIDGSCLGPLEMGTQVQTFALVQALARRPDVVRVAVALPGDVPPYARPMLSSSKVDARLTPTGDLSGFGSVDVAHQPFQPDGPVDITACGDMAARTVLTVLDLIAYRNRSYQTSAADWTTYRRRLFRTASLVDGVIAPTHDAGRQIRMERLPVDDDRLFIVPIGTDHLAGDEVGVMPVVLADSHGAGEPFVLVLGADYSHKNRDIAIRTLQELRGRGLKLSLVMAGMQVYGSSRIEEAAARNAADPVHILGDVTSEERNWLLRHASAVLYPTSAEGFGLVPFEAARFATPAIFVPFGPVGETLGSLPVTAADWSAPALAGAAETFLRDPEAATAQVAATLAIGAAYTWDACAASLVEVYRSLLARPAVEARLELGRCRSNLEAVMAERDEQQAINERLHRSRAYQVAARLEQLWGRLRP